MHQITNRTSRLSSVAMLAFVAVSAPAVGPFECQDALLDQISPWFEIAHVNSQGNLLFISGTDSSDPDLPEDLWVIDASDPSNLQVLGEWGINFGPNQLEFSGDIVYGRKAGRFLALNIADPLSPIQVGGYTPPGASFRDMEIDGDLAFLADSRFGLHIVDISDPASLIPLSTLELLTLRNVEIEGTTAFVTSIEGLYSIDVTDPTKPIVVGFFPTQNLANELDVVDGVAYFASARTLFIVDVSEPSDLRLISSSALPRVVSELQVIGSRGYIAINSSANDGLGVLNLFDLSNPSLDAVFLSDAAFDLHIVGTTAYLGHFKLEVIDLTHCRCHADFDSDGDLDSDDFFHYIDLFAAGNPGADIDGDRDLDSDDFFAFLELFQLGCD